jgi:hypothetical protein
MAEVDQNKEMHEAEIARIQGKMLKRSFFVMFREVVDPAKFRQSLRDHLLWLIELEGNGLIFASGPAFSEDEKPAPGMTVFRAMSFRQAQELAASDPVCRSGAAKFHVIRWMVGAGRVSVSIDFSDQKYSFT